VKKKNRESEREREKKKPIKTETRRGESATRRHFRRTKCEGFYGKEWDKK